MNQLQSDFANVMNYPESLYVFDFSEGYDPDLIRQKGWGIGRYYEKRANMYETPLFDDGRNIHMGIDIWAKAGEPVFSYDDGTVLYLRDNNQEGNYGPTIVARYRFSGSDLYALYGHLSRTSLEMVEEGQPIEKGQKIAELGRPEENGGWVPHLHFQLSVKDPGEADMPGVVSEDDIEEALVLYPDPRMVLGNLY